MKGRFRARTYIPTYQAAKAGPKYRGIARRGLVCGRLIAVMTSQVRTYHRRRRGWISRWMPYYL